MDNLKQSDNPSISKITFNIPEYHKIQYIKIVAKKLGKLPEWHLGHKHDGRSWIFADEITIE